MSTFFGFIFLNQNIVILMIKWKTFNSFSQIINDFIK